MEQLAWFIVEKGEPFETGTRINVNANDMVIGRTSGSVIPDISFTNFLISRKHCRIYRNADKIVLCDLGSKHGTTINGKAIPENVPHTLNNGDKISLAMGVVSFRFGQTAEFEKTMDIGSLLKLRPEPVAAKFTLDPEKRVCIIDGRSVQLAGKEWNFLNLLYANANKIVTYKDIKTAVWPERCIGGNNVPDVGMEEINVLIYRLRQKLGVKGKAIRTVRGCGCIIDT